MLFEMIKDKKIYAFEINRVRENPYNVNVWKKSCENLLNKLDKF